MTEGTKFVTIVDTTLLTDLVQLSASLTILRFEGLKWEIVYYRFLTLKEQRETITLNVCNSIAYDMSP